VKVQRIANGCRCLPFQPVCMSNSWSWTEYPILSVCFFPTRKISRWPPIHQFVGLHEWDVQCKSRTFLDYWTKLTNHRDWGKRMGLQNNSECNRGRTRFCKRWPYIWWFGYFRNRKTGKWPQGRFGCIIAWNFTRTVQSSYSSCFRCYIPCMRSRKFCQSW